MKYMTVWTIRPENMKAAIQFKMVAEMEKRMGAIEAVVRKYL